MSATPRPVDYPADRPFIRWFSSMYPGACAACGDPFAAGDRVGYRDVDGLVAFDCCAGPTEESTGEDYDILHRKASEPVMPRGKTVKDKCPRCFLIHTHGQGDECE